MIKDSNINKPTHLSKSVIDRIKDLKIGTFDNSYLPPSVRYNIELSELNTDFILNFLIKKKGKGKIDKLVLSSNKIFSNIKTFLEKQNATKFGYAKIIKQTDEYVILSITQDGIKHFKDISIKYKIIVPTQIERVSLWILKAIRKLTSFVFISANNSIKKAMESGIVKLILFIITILSFIMKDEISVWFKSWFNK